MIRTISLLIPVFVCIYWAVALRGDKKKVGNPRIFLSVFMLLTGVIFTAHFLYFGHFQSLYLFFDVPLQLLGLSIFPLYHIYFRLLTVDARFSLKAHAPLLILPVVVVLIYAVGVFFTPVNDYKEWLFHLNDNESSVQIKFLIAMRNAMRITFLITLAYSMIGNHWLLSKYGHKAEQFYSNIVDGKQKNARNINHVILALGLASVLITSIGRILLMPADWIIVAGWSLFAVLIYLIGKSGIKQKIINPSVDPEIGEEMTVLLTKIPLNELVNFWNKIIIEFEQNKVYLNSGLNIMDLVKTVGTNRTYISLTINQQQNQNFCGFVNGYRIEELKRVLYDNPGINQTELAQRCGFGSINSMKRSIYAKTGVSFNAFKTQYAEREAQPAES